MDGFFFAFSLQHNMISFCFFGNIVVGYAFILGGLWMNAGGDFFLGGCWLYMDALWNIVGHLFVLG